MEITETIDARNDVLKPEPAYMPGIGEHKMRNGSKAVVQDVADNSKFQFPLVGIVGGVWFVWMATGRYQPDCTSEFDLVAPWEEPTPEPAPEVETLRDKFAMAALTGLLCLDGYADPKVCFEVADAMMKERQGGDA